MIRKFPISSKKLHVGGARPAILSVTEPYNKDFIPKDANSSLPKPLTDLINEECTDMKEDELRRKCQGIKIDITQKEADLIECKTREQSKSKVWFKYRAGRITASRMKAACRTKLDNPSRSLIKAICYPESALFATKATNWGCEHEQCARDEYVKYTSQNHDNFKIEQAGLFINPTHPHLGASPDGVVTCDCCGCGVLEIKCPYCIKDLTASEHKCLSDTGTGPRLSRTHQYFYQIQTQIFICEKEFCDFVLWTNNSIHMERILPDTDFWQTICETASDFFYKVILLELTGRFYSHTREVEDHQQSTDTSKRKWCFCKKELPGW